MANENRGEHRNDKNKNENENKNDNKNENENENTSNKQQATKKQGASPTVAVLNADHELAKVLFADLVRDETPLVEQIKQLALLAELKHQYVHPLKTPKRKNERLDKFSRYDKQKVCW